MPKVTSIYYQRLETIQGKFANETYGCTVALGPNDTEEDAFLFAQESVASQHAAHRGDHNDWKGMYERAKVQLENLQANHATALRNIEDMKVRLRNASDLLDVQLEEIPF